MRAINPPYSLLDSAFTKSTFLRFYPQVEEGAIVPIKIHAQRRQF
jgi:hypothetical protein